MTDVTAVDPAIPPGLRSKAALAPFVIIYTRISVADIRYAREQAAELGLSADEADRLMREKVEMHAAECREYARNQGWTVGYEDADNNRSASQYSTKNLPGRERTLDEIRAHSGQRVILVTTEIPRLLRKNDDAGLFRHVIRRPHLVIMCTQGDPEGEGERYDLNTNKGVERFYDAVNRAEAESANISERRRRRERRRATAGEFWGNAPFGYAKRYTTSADGQRRYTGTLDIVPGEAKVIREAAALLIASDGGRPVTGLREPWQGSLRQIVLDWNAAGLRGRDGAPWSQKTLGGLLLNPTLNGWRVHRAGDNDGRAPRGSDGTRKRGVWEPILDDDTFARLGAVLTDTRRRTARSNAIVHPGAGLVYAACGALCKGHVSPGHERADGTRPRTRAYVCPDPAAGGDRCVRRDADAVEALMRDYVNLWLEPGGDYDRYLELLRARGDLAAQLAETRREIGELEQRQRDADAAAARGTMSWERAGAIERDIGRQVAELAAVRDALEAAVTERAGQMEPARPVHADQWGQWSPAEQNAWLRRFIGRVTIRPTGRGVRIFNPEDVDVEPGPWADEIGRGTTAVLPPSVARPSRSVDAVAAWLAGHPGATAREIAAGTGINWSSAYAALDALERAGRVTRERPGRGRGGGKVSMRFALADPPGEAAGSLSSRAAVRAVTAYWNAAAARSVPGSVHVMSSPRRCAWATSWSGV